jgi:multidrug efflux pump
LPGSSPSSSCSGGLLALRQLPVASYPAVAPPALAITVNYPGASAKVVEETAVALIEQELNGIENLLYMDSASEQNIGTITLTFQAGTNLDLASVETQNRIKRAEPRLPEEVRRLGITVVKSARNYLMFISLFSPDKSQDNVALGSYAAANVLESIRRTPGVGEAILFGTEYSMRLWLKPERLTCLRPDAGRRGQGRARAERPDRHRRTGPGAGSTRPGICRDHHHPGAPGDARGVRRT